MITMEKELEIATDFLNEICDNLSIDEPNISRVDVLEVCRDAIERLGFTESYSMFRAAFEPN